MPTLATLAALACGTQTSTGARDSGGSDAGLIDVKRDGHDAADAPGAGCWPGSAGCVTSFQSIAAVATYAQFMGYGFRFMPDGTFSVLPNGAQLTFFASGGTNAACAANPNTQGSFRLTGTLDSIAAGDCTALFLRGAAAAYGWSFDKDYAGGGPTLAIGDLLFMAYHGEEHFVGEAGTMCQFDNAGFIPCYYASLGLALSKDGATHFASIGEIVQAYQPLSAFVGGTRNLTMGYGPLILANANGDPSVDAGPGDYVYVFFNDFDPKGPGVCGANDCFAVARAAKTALVAAAASGSPSTVASLFRKYDATKGDPWSEPATSGDPTNETAAGHFTPLFSDQYTSQASVVYDAYLGGYVLAYFYENTVPIRVSRDLLHWSGPVATYVPPSGKVLSYPTLVGSGRTLRLFFSTFATFPVWTGSELDGIPLKLN